MAAAVPEARALVPSLRPGSSDRQVMRASLAALVELGAPARLAEVFDERDRRYVAVPTYPFEHERFWVEPRAATLTAAAPTPSTPRTIEAQDEPAATETSHPLLGAWVRLPGNEARFRARVHGDGELAEHRIGGLPVLPLSRLVEAALRALGVVFGPGTHALDALEVHTPLFLPPGEPQELELTLSPRRADAVAVTLRARDAEATSAWAELGAGSATLGVSDAPATTTTTLAALRARCTTPFAVDELFAGLAALGVEHGPLYRGIREAWRGAGELVARVEPGDAGAPAMLDLGLQAVGMAAADAAATRLLFPLGLGRCVVRAGTVAWVAARAQPVGDGGFVGAADLLDADGRVLASLEDVRLAPATARDLLRARDARLAAWVHELAWRSLPTEPAASRAQLGGRWLLLADGSEVGAALRRALAGAGAAVAQAFAGASFRELEPGLYEHAVDDATAYRALLDPAAAALGGALDGVIQLATERAHSPSAALERCARALHLGRALTDGSAPPPRLLLVTRGAQPVGAVARPDVFASPLWGLGRALAVEHPELRCTLVDLDPDAMADHGNDLLGALAVGREDQLAVRDGVVAAARLVPASVETRQRLAAAPELALSPEATYLVTGGLGGLGLQVAEWLVARGARHVALLSRRAPDGEQAARLDALAAAGAVVRAHRCDVTDEAAVAEALRAIEADGPPVRGVLHAAAVIDDALLAGQSGARLQSVLAPKVAGTWNLHRALDGRRLDFFVSFSSLVSLMGAAGQANYAAANAFLDGFAALRRGLGLLATTIQWGPWAGAGSAQALADQRRWDEMGLSKIPPSLGLRAIEQAIGSERASLAVLPIAWEKLLGRLPPEATPPLYTELRAQLAATAAPVRAIDHALVGSLRAAPSVEARRAILLPWLQREAAEVLRLASADVVGTTRPLSELGFDSLLAVELRNIVQQTLGCTLAVSALFAHPTLLGLSEFLAQQLGAGAAAPAAPSLVCAPPAPSLACATPAPIARRDTTTRGGVDLSLIYFASGTSGPDDDKYRHVLAQARIADEAGFGAIWIPERHFFEFGALYPEPSMLAAALATVTRRIRLRAGSVVVPLHHPVQLAERWAMVDNLSGGRVDLSLATGWSPIDFVFAPDKYAERLQAMRQGAATLARLWRGEPISATNGVGEPVELRLFPRPVQRELPLWYTCSGGIERFVEAGAAGAHVLTALLFQSHEQLGDKVAAYRRARAEHGHDPDAGIVTLMLHAYAHEDASQVVPTVREPFLAYLASTAKVWLEVSSAATVRSIEQMSAAERADVLEMAFHRYVHTAGLFGTPAACVDKVRALAGLGVNEVACLVDFGLPPDVVGASLRSLASILDACKATGLDGSAELEELVL
jgi:myxalamid-type polyketide synthase MxaE and MxaD